jgi:hypothetical protein
MGLCPTKTPKIILFWDLPFKNGHVAIALVLVGRSPPKLPIVIPNRGYTRVLRSSDCLGVFGEASLPENILVLISLGSKIAGLG